MVHSWIFVYFEYVNKASPSVHTLTRLVTIAVLITLWCMRLVFNYWRKDGYSTTVEDYRWIHVRKWFDYPEKKFLWNLFNFTFISLYQCWLLLSIVLPLWYIQKYNRTEQLNYVDTVLVCLFLLLLVMETVADQQQWNFQNAKYEWLKTKINTTNGYFTDDDFKRGFLVKGLFRYSRHPVRFLLLPLFISSNY
jgi:steroid 5-alpha reductase family enzyme